MTRVNTLSLARLQALVDEFDADGSGEVDFEEFLALITKFSQSREEEIKAHGPNPNHDSDPNFNLNPNSVSGVLGTDG